MGSVDPHRPGGRVAELAISLSLATDLGTGQPLEHGMRTCWLALRTAEELGLDPSGRSVVYLVALLRFIGCTSDAAVTAQLSGGDEISFNATMGPMLNAAPREQVSHLVRHLGAGLTAPRRGVLVARALADPQGAHRSLSGHCDVAARFATRLGLGPDVVEALSHAYERWDGRGAPDGLSGSDIPLAVRITTVVRDAEMWARTSGWTDAVATLRARAGDAYDPAVVEVVAAAGERWSAQIGDDPCEAVLDAEPVPVVTFDTGDVEDALLALADFADLKSTWSRGHSRGVSDLASAATAAAGIDGVTIARRAALVHDIGRVGIPNGIWDRPTALTAAQFERIRMHTYLTERILGRSALLQPFARVAARHHERADGSGYHRGETADDLDPVAQVLAAADAYHAMTETRPHREARRASEAADQLNAESRAGLFSRDAVDAVLEAAGHQPASRPKEHPAGLTDREIEVLRLIAAGLLNKQVARRLGISPKTVSSHLEHIYAKAAVTTRAGATLFAMEHRLVGPTVSIG